jgi:transposase
VPRRFPPELRQCALRMLEEALPKHETECAVIRRHVGAQLGFGPKTLRKWRRCAEVDSGVRPDITCWQSHHLGRDRLRRHEAKELPITYSSL